MACSVPELRRSGGALRVDVEFSVRHRYPVVFTRDIFNADNPVLEQALETSGGPAPCLFVVDDGVAQAFPDLEARIARYATVHADRMRLSGPPVIVAGGERAKTDPDHLQRLRRATFDAKLDRHAYLIAVGGGAVLDLAGFVAATAHRGVRHVRIPSTTLAQNDAGVGVKNGVNYGGVKNYLGAFAAPAAVLSDFDLLEGLSPAVRRAGLSEAVKVALIRDGGFFSWLEQRADDLATFAHDAEEEMIRRCAALHVNQIAHGGDPFERGSARPLDFGHWAAHKLESLSAGTLSHGDAVAIGVALDARYAALCGLARQGEDARTAALLRRLGFGLFHPALRQTDGSGRLRLLDGLEEFREHLGGALTITLIEGPGRGIEVHEMDPGLIEAAIGWLEADAA